MLCIFWALPWYFRLKSDSCLNIIFKLSLSINKLLMFWGFLKTWVSSDLLRLNSLLFMWIHFSTYFCDGKDFNLSSSFLVVFFELVFLREKENWIWAHAALLLLTELMHKVFYWFLCVDNYEFQFIYLYYFSCHNFWY